MKKKWIAWILVLLLLPAAVVCAAQAGYADSLMEESYAVIGGDQSLTICSHVSLSSQGGYTHALYQTELTGEETKEELDALARQLLQSDAKPVWGGGKHCYHGGVLEHDVEYKLSADEWEPGSYLYVCSAFACSGSGHNHVLSPCYERISTMAVRVTAEAEGLALSYALLDAQGKQSAVFAAGDEVTLALDGGVQTLMLLSGVEYSVERITAVEADFPKELAADAFAFDEAALELTPRICGSGSITVTIGNYLNDETRTETIYIEVPCAPQESLTVLQENTCTEDGLGVYRCRGYGVNCETEFDQEIIPAHGHEVVSVSQIIEKPKATLPGRGLGTCHLCGAVDTEVELAPIFSDVAGDAFYSRALDHCYAEGWVSGVSADAFAPNNACVRAQAVTFLWRAAGEPEPETEENPFVDVKPEDFYYDAVLWAVEKGITNGTSADRFSPMGVCNRAQVVTFLWRAFGQPQSENQEHPFTDVQTGSWYEAPVLWAVEEGITSGMSATAFGPTANCNRAQIVTFLFRAYVE